MVNFQSIGKKLDVGANAVVNTSYAAALTVGEVSTRYLSNGLLAAGERVKAANTVIVVKQENQKARTVARRAQLAAFAV